jgi:hypothetical protein
MLHRWDDSQKYLSDNVHLVCEETANYLVIWCIDLEVEEVSVPFPAAGTPRHCACSRPAHLFVLAEMCTDGAGSSPDHGDAVYSGAGQESEGRPPSLLPAVFHQDQGNELLCTTRKSTVQCAMSDIY